MKFDKRILGLLILTLLIVGGYLPYRLGFWAPDSLPVKAMNKATVAILGDSKIENIQMADHTDNHVKFSFDVFYNGEFGKVATMGRIELITTEYGRDYVYGKTHFGIRRGKNNSEVMINRPYQLKDELGVDKIRISLFPSAQIMEEKHDMAWTTDIEFTWPSLVSENEMHSTEFWQHNAQSLFYGRQYGALARNFDAWNNTELRDVDGKWRLNALDTINELHSYTGEWDSHWKIIQKGREQYPESAAFALLEAGYWIRYAWDARGSGYASSITETGRQLFRERLDKAEQILLESKDYASDNPVWYQLYLTTAMAKGWNLENILALFAEAISNHPTNYQIYFNAANALSPKWGGSTELMDLIARAAEEIIDGPEKDVIYARVYWSISRALRENEDLFSDSSVSWPRMKTGFYQLISDFPDSDWNLNHFGLFACQAGDSKAYQDIRSRIGQDRILLDVWTGNTSMEACDRSLLSAT